MELLIKYVFIHLFIFVLFFTLPVKLILNPTLTDTQLSGVFFNATSPHFPLYIDTNNTFAWFQKY